MKTVFSTSFEVAHLFANKLHTSARCANTSINAAYNSKDEVEAKHYRSYSTVIATHIENDKGEPAVLINDYNYSVTTAKHQRELYQACRHLLVFRTSTTEIDRVYARISEIIENLVPKAKARKEDYLHEARALLASYEAYHIWMHGQPKKRHSWNKSVKYLKAVKLVEIADDAQKLATYTAAEIRAEEKRRMAAQRAEIRRAKQMLAEYHVELKQWLNHERRRAPWYPVGQGEDFLRVSKDGSEVETTQGVRVPIESARVLYRLIVAGKDIKGHVIDGYTVKSLNGVLTIGCHRINVENMHSVGRSIIAE